MKSITFSIIFHSTTWNSMLKLLKDCKKYSVNAYASVEISLNTCRNTLDFMCDLELFSKIRSHMLFLRLHACTGAGKEWHAERSRASKLTPWKWL